MKGKLRHPFWQTALIIVVSWLLFKFGIGWLSVIGLKSAPAPNTVVL